MAGFKNRIGYLEPITHISRKFARRIDTVGVKVTSVKSWIGAAASTLGNKNMPGGNYKNWLVIRKKAGPKNPTADQTLNRNRFKAVAAAVITRSKDLSKISADQAAFMAQLGQPGCVYTMKAWYWMVECEAYDQSHS